MKKLLLIALAACAIASCDVLKQAQGTYNLVNCKYEFESLDNIHVAGVNLSKGVSIMDAPRILGLLSGGASSIPVEMRVNLAVQNPNPTEALLHGMEYTLSIDGIEFTSGSTTQAFRVASGGHGTLPLALSFDVATLLGGETRDATLGVLRNLLSTAGVGNGNDTPSRVTLNIRPSFDIAGRIVPSPVSIPVSFSFGGR